MSSNASFLIGCAMGSAGVLLGNWTGWLIWKRQSDRELRELRRLADAAEQRVRDLLGRTSRSS